MALVLQSKLTALHSKKNRHMKKSVYVLIMLFLTINSAIFAQSNQLLQEASFNEPVLSSGVLEKSKTFLLKTDELKRVVAESPEKLQFSLPKINGGSFEIALEKREVLFSGFNVKTPDGLVDGLDYGVHYGGKLADDPNSLIAFSFFNHCLFGLIATDEGNFNVVFLRDENGNPTQRYVLYNDRDLTIPNTFKCGMEELPNIEKEQHFTEKSGGSSCRMLTQYLECDYRMFQDNGSSVQNTLSWTTSMFNVMSYIYHTEMINLQISEIFVWNVDDPYTDDAGDALGEFGDARQNNFNGDLAHFLTTLPSGNGGLAWLNVICAQYSPGSSYGPYAYSNIDDSFSNLPLWSWTINVVTHETGHNIGSPHTQWCGWEFAPNDHHSIDSCYATEDYNGDECYQGPEISRTGTIMSYCHLNGNVNLNLGFGPLPGNLIRERFNEANCITTYNGPAMPTLNGQTQYCVHDHILLTANSSEGPISWTGPNGFTSSSDSVSILDGLSTNAGIYVASVTVGNCTSSEFVNVQVTPRPSTPNIIVTGNSLKCVPGSSTYTYTWYNSGGTQVGTGQTFTPAASGQYYVVITRNGCSSNQSALYTYTAPSNASIDENGNNTLHIWPNPANEIIHIDYTFNENANNNILVFDMSGRVVIQKNITSTNNVSIDISQLSGGMYVLELQSNGQKTRNKFLVNN